MARYTDREIAELLTEYATLIGRTVSRTDPGGLFVRTRDARVGGISIAEAGANGRGYADHGIDGTRGEVGRVLTERIAGASMALANRATTDRPPALD